jgi:hypothetical protein
MHHIEIIDKQGKITKYTDIQCVLNILADAKLILQRQIHVISLVEKESNDGTRICTDWYLKTIDEQWYPESEARIKSMSKEYCDMVNNHILDDFVWVHQNYKQEDMQGIDFKLHITREIDIHQYRSLFESTSIRQVISHSTMQRILGMLEIPGMPEMQALIIE